MASKQPNPQSQWQLQARIGLLIMSLATLSFQAICKSAFTTAQPDRRPENDFAGFSDAQIQTLLSNLARMNATLHAKLDSLQAVGTWLKRNPAQGFSKEESAAFGAIFALGFWIGGALLCWDALSNVSILHLKRTVITALLSANAGLAYAVLWLLQPEWYTYFLCVLWPAQVAMAWELFLHEDNETRRIKKLGNAVRESMGLRSGL